MKKLIFAGTALLLLAIASPGAAVEGECQTVEGQDRDCTMMENLESCIEDAVDAAAQRAEGGELNLWFRFLMWDLDVAACVLTTPFK